MKVEFPLYEILVPNINRETGQINPGPVVGDCNAKDTSKLNSFFNDDEFMSNFNPDIKFVCKFNPGDKTRKICGCYPKRKINGYVMDGAVITDAQQALKGRLKFQWQ